MRAILSPEKANSPLVVDADAVLSFAVAHQRFKLIAGRRTQARQLRSGMELKQLASSYPLNVLESGYRSTMEKQFRIGTCKRNNHEPIIICVTESAKENFDF